MRIGTDKSAYGTHGFSVVGSGATRKLFSKKSSREKFALGDDWSRRRGTRKGSEGRDKTLIFSDQESEFATFRAQGQESTKIPYSLASFFSELFGGKHGSSSD